MASTGAITRPRILGTGRHAPEKILTNHDLERMVDTSDEWIVERTGIRTRHIASADEATSDFTLHAARRAMTEAGLTGADLDAIICATVTPDNPFPSMACRLQALLEARDAFAFDISAACSGWIYGLGIARGFIDTGVAKHVLLIGAEALSKIVDWTDRTTCILFGDGAGATVLGPSHDERGVLSCCLAADGERYELLYQPGGGTRIPASKSSVEAREHTVRMRGNEVFKFAVRNMEKLARQAVEEAGLTMDDVDVCIPHQANRRIIDQTAQRLGIPEERLYVNVDRYGNTSAASIPIALDEARREGRVEDGDVVCVVAFGGGFTYGASVIRM